MHGDRRTPAPADPSRRRRGTTARFSSATCSRHATRRGHARQSTICAVEGAQRRRSGHRIRVEFAAVRVLLVVNPAASSVTPRVRAEVEGILGGAHDVDVAETTAAVTPPRSPARRSTAELRRGRGARRRRHAQRGRRRSRRVTASPWRRCRAGRRTCSPARSASRTRPPTRPVSSSTRWRATRVGASVWARPRPRTCRSATSSSTSAWGSTPPSSDGWKAGRRSNATTSRIPCSRRRRSRRGSATTTAARASGSPSTARMVGDGPYAVVSNSDPYAYVGRRPLRIAPGCVARRRPCGHRVAHAAGVGRDGRRRRRSDGSPTSRRRPRSSSSPTSTRW